LISHDPQGFFFFPEVHVTAAEDWFEQPEEIQGNNKIRVFFLAKELL